MENVAEYFKKSKRKNIQFSSPNLPDYQEGICGLFGAVIMSLRNTPTMQCAMIVRLFSCKRQCILFVIEPEC